MRKTSFVHAAVIVALLAGLPCFALADDFAIFDDGFADEASSDREVWDGDDGFTDEVPSDREVWDGDDGFADEVSSDRKVLDEDEVWDGGEDAQGVTFNVAGGNVYTGSEVKPAVTDVMLDGETLVEGSDYVLSYEDNVNPGVASVTVSPAGTRKFEPKTANFAIGRLPLSFANITLSGAGIAYDDDGANPSAAYDGSEKTPEVHVTVNGVELACGSDFNVEYKDNRAVGTASVTVTASAFGNCSGSKVLTFEITGVPMIRLYNPFSGEHLYTASKVEVEACVSRGWINEGEGWVAPAESSTPVYRLYNPHVEGGDHLYTVSEVEYNFLAEHGWKKEGVAWYSDDAKGVPIYRQYNPFAITGMHNYTASTVERDSLLAHDWNSEGIAWYGVK